MVSNPIADSFYLLINLFLWDWCSGTRSDISTWGPGNVPLSVLSGLRCLTTDLSTVSLFYFFKLLYALIWMFKLFLDSLNPKTFIFMSWIFIDFELCEDLTCVIQIVQCLLMWKWCFQINMVLCFKCENFTYVTFTHENFTYVNAFSHHVCKRKMTTGATERTCSFLDFSMFHYVQYSLGLWKQSTPICLQTLSFVIIKVLRHINRE